MDIFEHAEITRKISDEELLSGIEVIIETLYSLDNTKKAAFAIDELANRFRKAVGLDAQ